MNMNAALKTLTRTMKALSDPSRVRILKYLQHRSGMCVCELTALLHVSQPTVSKHLKLLEETGFVESSKQGLWVNYALARRPENPFAAAMLRELSGWLEEEPAIQDELVRVRHVRREVVTGRQPIAPT